ncbi:MAG: CARDB domain-containing protein [Nanoarchaeota archaeon]
MNNTSKIMPVLLLAFFLCTNAYAADLEVSNIFTNGYSTTGELTSILLSIKNNGGETLYNVDYEVNTDSSAGTVRYTLPYLHANTVIAASADWVFPNAGQFLISAEVDPDNDIAEGDETNNIKFASIIAHDDGADYDHDSDDCRDNEKPSCSTNGCYFRGHAGENIEGEFNAGCCWDDINEKYTSINCASGTDCVSDSNAGTCCDTRDNDLHPFSDYPNYDCTDGYECFAPTESTDINEDTHDETCWWGRWREPDSDRSMCAFYSKDCTEEEYWGNMAPGSSSGSCDNSLRWLYSGEYVSHGEYPTYQVEECCGDDADEYLTMNPPEVEFVASQSINFPTGLDLDPEGDRLFVTEYSSGKLYACDLGLTDCSEVFSGIALPFAVAVKDGSNRVYVASLDGVWDLNCPDSCFLNRLALTEYSPEAITVDENSNIFIVDESIIMKFDSSFNYITSHNLETDAEIYDLNVDKNGNLFVAGYLDHKIYKLDNDLTQVLDIYGDIASPVQVNSPISIDIDDDNNLYVVEHYGQRAFKFHPGLGLDEKIWAFGEYETNGCDESHLKQPYKLRKHISDNYYITDRDCNRIIRLSVAQDPEVKCCASPNDVLVDGHCTSTCADGTPLYQCTANPPYYCGYGQVIEEDCTQCGGCSEDEICHTASKTCVPENNNFRDEHFMQLCLTEDVAFCGFIETIHQKDLAYLNYATDNLDDSYCSYMSPEYREMCGQKVLAYEVGHMAVCGDNYCFEELGESCFSCPQDCGVCGDRSWSYSWYKSSKTCNNDCLDWSSTQLCNQDEEWGIETDVNWGGDELDCISIDPYPYGYDIHGTGGEFAFETQWVQGDLYRGGHGSCYDRTGLVSSSDGDGGLRGGKWWLGTFMTWIYVTDTYTKTFDMSVDDDITVLNYNNCGECFFDPDKCELGTFFKRNGPWPGPVTIQLTKGWNVVEFGFIEDTNLEYLNYEQEITEKFSIDPLVAYMDSEGAENVPGCGFGWTACVDLYQKSCNDVCAQQGESCVEYCTTSRGYEDWGAEAWFDADECSAPSFEGSGQQRCDFVDTESGYSQPRWKCCCSETGREMPTSKYPEPAEDVKPREHDPLPSNELGGAK